ncbi:hypothetical protein [Xanthobacter versatilis]|uniref:hypothetical protein n=1 Tax=Xanthobacter autotrophicus (strain ATCC BAA-1158 / Py2) TaxID=78245 RepID=UPI00372C3D1C
MSKLHRLMSRPQPRPRERRPAKTMPRVIEDRTTPTVFPPARDRWDVVMLSPAANDGTLARIDAAGFDVWRPRAAIQVSSAMVGKVAFVNRPLWPRYAFVGRRDAVGSLSDVWSIGKPLTVGSVSGALVDAIAAREMRGEFDCRTVPEAGQSFADGAEVETLDGLMAGIVLKSDEQRTVVLFRLMDSDRPVVVETCKLKVRA